MRMNSDSRTSGKLFWYCAYNFFAVLYHTAAFCFAQGKDFCSALNGSLKSFHRVFAVVKISCKEMLCIVYNVPSVCAQISARIANHCKIFRKSCLYNIRNLKSPGFSENNDPFGACGKKALKICILRAFYVLAARRTECAKFWMFKRNFFHLMKKFHILRIASRISGFNISYTDIIKRLTNMNFILNWKTDALALSPVTQCRIQDFNIHIRHNNLP